MENQTVVKEESLEELRERLAREQAIRDEEHAKRQEQFKRIEELIWKSIEHTIISTYRLEQFNKELEKINEDIKSISQVAKSIVGDRK